MNDKILDLLEKVYIELQETKKEVQQGKEETNNRFSKIEMMIEHNISDKLDSLFEFKDMALEQFGKINKKLEEISEKVEKHDIKIQVIDSGKKKKSS